MLVHNLRLWTDLECIFSLVVKERCSVTLTIGLAYNLSDTTVCKYGYEYAVVHEPCTVDNQEPQIDHYISSCCSWKYTRSYIGCRLLTDCKPLCGLYCLVDDYVLRSPRTSIFVLCMSFMNYAISLCWEVSVGISHSLFGMTLRRWPSPLCLEASFHLQPLAFGNAEE